MNLSPSPGLARKISEPVRSQDVKTGKNPATRLDLRHKNSCKTNSGSPHKNMIVPTP